MLKSSDNKLCGLLLIGPRRADLPLNFYVLTSTYFMCYFKYSKTGLIRHLYNLFHCVIQRVFSHSHLTLFYVFPLCNVTLSIPTQTFGLDRFHFVLFFLPEPLSLNFTFLQKSADLWTSYTDVIFVCLVRFIHIVFAFPLCV